MKKELIMFIAFKTTENYVTQEWGRSNHLNRAKALLAVTIAINVVKILLLLNLLFFHKTLQMNEWIFSLCFVIPLLFYILVNMFFKKNLLAKSINLYKNTNIATYARGIGLLYFFLSLSVAIFLVYKMRTTGYLPFQFSK